MNGFPFVANVDVRYADIDAMNHVNNAIYVTYLEAARTRLWRELIGFNGGARDVPFVVARVTIDYRSPIALTDTVAVGIALSAIGRTSFTFEYRIEASGRCAAEAESVQVHYDYAAQRPSPIPAVMRERLATLQPAAPHQ
jgi:acyl-CoA thioester hydrolase